MRSKIFQRILDKYESEPWYYKLKVKIKLELYTIYCMGIVKYVKWMINNKIKNNLQRC